MASSVKSEYTAIIVKWRNQLPYWAHKLRQYSTDSPSRPLILVDSDSFKLHRDMDDSLETPDAVPIEADRLKDEGEQSSGDEDGGPDWTTLVPAASRPVIPKRGEKEFEPAPGGGSGLQLHTLDRARAAMFDALRATRATSSKSMSYGIWYPDIARAHVTLARGVHFSTMGHSVPRPAPAEENPKMMQKRLELLPEETVYLVERGALFCWKENLLLASRPPDLQDVDGSPMSVQQAFAEMIGREDLTLEKYQVFAYLKRLGYTVTRAKPPSSSYPIPATSFPKSSRPSIMARIFSVFPVWLFRIRKIFTKISNWWRPIRIGGWMHHNKNYASIFKSLRFIPAGHKVPLPSTKLRRPTDSPYNIFFHLYKPSTPFRKTVPPPPDFSIVVVNARTTPMPSLHELTALFETQPELPPPLPRRRPTNEPVPSLPINDPPPPMSAFLRIFTKAFWWPIAATASPSKPNAFMALKAGKKNIVIAVVDSGNISFFRFGEGAFSEWPMI